MVKTALLIDGGALREFARMVDQTFNADYVEDFVRAVLAGDERLLRVLYYDAPLFVGTVSLPISGDRREYPGGSTILDELARRERFAVRKGVLAFRGWRPKPRPGDAQQSRYYFSGSETPVDGDFEPIFVQKGVDMRIGLDIAGFAERGTVERILLATTDSDLVAAMKYARRAGLEVGIVQLPRPAWPLSAPLLEHSDFVRDLR